MSDNQEQNNYWKLRPQLIKDPNQHIQFPVENQIGQNNLQNNTNLTQQQQFNNSRFDEDEDDENIRFSNNIMLDKNSNLPQNIQGNPGMNIPNNNISQNNENNENMITEQEYVTIDKNKDYNMQANVNNNNNQFPVTAQSIIIKNESKGIGDISGQNVISQNEEKLGQNELNNYFNYVPSSPNKEMQNNPMNQLNTENQNQNQNNQIQNIAGNNDIKSNKENNEIKNNNEINFYKII